jgi:hypothetical protein
MHIKLAVSARDILLSSPEIRWTRLRPMLTESTMLLTIVCLIEMARECGALSVPLQAAYLPGIISALAGATRLKMPRFDDPISPAPN